MKIDKKFTLLSWFSVLISTWILVRQCKIQPWRFQGVLDCDVKLLVRHQTSKTVHSVNGKVSTAEAHGFGS